MGKKAKQEQSETAKGPDGQRYCPKCGSIFQNWVEVCIDCGTELTDEMPDIPLDGSSHIPGSPAEASTHAKKVKPENIVTLATYYHPEEANLSQAKLESEGIPSFVADENMVTCNRLYAIGLGGVRLMVRESDVEKAIEILQLDKEEVPVPSINDEEYCPECNSRDVEYNTLSISRICISILLLGFPIPFFKRKWRCKNCGCEWRY